MTIHIEVHYTINNIGVLSKGNFRVVKDEVSTACNFVKQLQREYPYDLILKKVIVDNEKDITEEVRKMLKPPLP